MDKKPKFKPVVTRVKLNPEQAVLQCNCYNSGFVPGGSYHYPGYTAAVLCVLNSKEHTSSYSWTDSPNAQASS